MHGQALPWLLLLLAAGAADMIVTWRATRRLLTFDIALTADQECPNHGEVRARDTLPCGWRPLIRTAAPRAWCDACQRSRALFTAVARRRVRCEIAEGS